MVEPVIDRWVNGKIKTERYYDPNKTTRSYHREDGPAVIKYNTAGGLDGEIYYLHGKKHRLDGYADTTGSWSKGHYYIHGIYISKKHYDSVVEKIKLINSLNELLKMHNFSIELDLGSNHNTKEFSYKYDDCAIKKGKKIIKECKYEELESVVQSLI